MVAVGVGTAELLEEAGEENEALEAVNILFDLGVDINGVDDNGDTVMYGAVYNISLLVMKLFVERGADLKIWLKLNKVGGMSLFIVEGYIICLLCPDALIFEVVTKLMNAAGISIEGERLKMIDFYEKVPEPPTKASKLPPD